MNEPRPDWNAERVVAHLKSLKNPENLAGMARYGIDTTDALGISNAILRPLGKQIKRDHQRAMALWQTGIREARLLAAFTAEPKKLTSQEARRWASDFNSWEIVDGVADVFMDARLDDLIPEFAAEEREFVRRTAFAMIAWGSVHLKKEPDETILAWLPLIEDYATDPRNFVKKAVNWALRSIGKRNLNCHEPALALARKLAESSDKTKRWIGSDAVRELTAEKTLARIKP